jgi:hypothetical protein
MLVLLQLLLLPPMLPLLLMLVPLLGPKTPSLSSLGFARAKPGAPSSLSACCTVTLTPPRALALRATRRRRCKPH